MAGTVPRMSTPKKPRDRATVSNEIREIERYLVDAPPHSGQGHRTELRAKLDRLKRELAAIDADRRSR